MIEAHGGGQCANSRKTLVAEEEGKKRSPERQDLEFLSFLDETPILIEPV
jgi:hypothetical protein